MMWLVAGAIGCRRTPLQLGVAAAQTTSAVLMRGGRAIRGECTYGDCESSELQASFLGG